MRYKRLELLFGKEKLDFLHSKKVLLLGVGGVGSFCLDCLYRTGITQLTIVDYDTYDVTNQNRQMWSEMHEGEIKVDALKEHYPKVEHINYRIDKAWIESFDFDAYDLIIDAIDDTQAKIALAHKCYAKLLSSMGSAKRTDPLQMKYRSIWETDGDRFARKIRYQLRKSGFDGDYMVLYSDEEQKCVEKGSFMAVTGSFGLTLCSKAIDKLLENYP